MSKRIEALAFANWLALNGWYSTRPTDAVSNTMSIVWRLRNNHDAGSFTTSELYDQFCRSLASV